jgi:hypothetical protein
MLLRYLTLARGLEGSTSADRKDRPEFRHPHHRWYLLSTDQEMIHARNTVDAHARFMMNDELLLILTEQFSVDLGSCLRWGKPALLCL